MKIKILNRREEDFTRTRPNELQKSQRNVDPNLHPFEKPREYVRALNTVKLGRVFAKPFLKALDGHKDTIFCLAKHPTKLSLLASGSADGEVKLWNISSGKNIGSVEYAHKGFVRGLAVNSEGQILSCGSDKYIHLFDVIQKSWDLPLYDDPSYYSSGRVEDSLILEQKIRSFSKNIIRDEKPLLSWIGEEPFTSLSHHYSENIFATSGSDGIHIWDYQRSEAISKLVFGNNPDTYIKVSYNPIERDILAASASDRSIVLFDLRTNTPIRKTVLSMNTNAIAWNPMEAFNFTIANEDHNCYTYDMRKLSIALNVHTDHVGAVMDLDYSPTGREFVTGSYDRTMRIFSIDEGRSKDVYHTKRMQRIFSVKYTSDANFVISGSDDTNIRIWKAQSNKPLGIMAPRQRERANYGQKLVERYKHMPDLKKILRKRHTPKSIYRVQQLKRVIKDSQRKKLFNRRAHSAPGKVTIVPERRKNFVREME